MALVVHHEKMQNSMEDIFHCNSVDHFERTQGKATTVEEMFDRLKHIVAPWVSSPLQFHGMSADLIIRCFRGVTLPFQMD